MLGEDRGPYSAPGELMRRTIPIFLVLATILLVLICQEALAQGMSTAASAATYQVDLSTLFATVGGGAVMVESVRRGLAIARDFVGAIERLTDRLSHPIVVRIVDPGPMHESPTMPPRRAAG